MVNWEEKNGHIFIYNLTNFDPFHTFDCGQCFRWNLLPNSHWLGVAHDIVLELDWDGHNMTLFHTSAEVFINVWHPYFDLGRDYDEVKAKLSEKDPIMAEAIRFGQGMRLLKQDFSEMAVSFLISQNNGIPRIRKIIESLSAAFGNRIKHTDGTYYSFPDLERLAGLSLEDFGVIRAGYRDKYIHRASKQLYSKEIDMSTVLGQDKINSRLEMLKLFGVGEKVADCILLFSGTRTDIFPVDRWVKRVMAELYLGYEANYAELSGFATERFGDLAGFAQQYLFYYARENKIGM